MVDKSVERGGSAYGGEIILDLGFQSEIKEQTFGIVVETERSDGGLEFDTVSCGGFRLAEVRQFILASGFKIAIKV